MLNKWTLIHIKFSLKRSRPARSSGSLSRLRIRSVAMRIAMGRIPMFPVPSFAFSSQFSRMLFIIFNVPLQMKLRLLKTVAARNSCTADK